MLRTEKSRVQFYNCTLFVLLTVEMSMAAQCTLPNSYEKLRLPGASMTDEKIKDMVIHALGVPAHAVLPKTTNQRIQQQSGAFFLFGMSFAAPVSNGKPVLWPKGYMPYCGLNIDQEESICPIIKKIRIPAECKQNIMEELDLLNINEGFLFPELEYQSKNVVQYVQKKISPQK